MTKPPSRSKSPVAGLPKRRSSNSCPDTPLSDSHSRLLHSDYPDDLWFRSLRTRSLNWFRRNGRQLPWRADVDSPPTAEWTYRVWISEVMLQQTQVQTVIDYFNRFIDRFPSIKSLAEAPETEVLSLWEGLGYYRRARSLQAAAKQIVCQYGGDFPQDYEDVLSLPGIGRYTAGAILSISHDQRLPILEGNTFRLHARLLGLIPDPRERESEKLLWQFATDLLPGKKSKLRSGQLNQALMELGSEICTVKKPKCDACPLMNLCSAHQLGLEEKIPHSASKTQYEDLHQVLLVLEDQESKVLVRQRQDDEWWSGLWDFVRISVPKDLTFTADSRHAEKLAGLVDDELGLRVPLPEQPDFTLKHAVTKYRIRLDCFHIQQSKWSSSGRYELKSMEEMANLPLNVTARKAIDRITQNNSASKR